MTNKRTWRILVIFYVLLILAFASLALIIHYKNPLGPDITLSREIQFEQRTFDKSSFAYLFFYYVSFLGKPLVAALIEGFFILLFFYYRYFREAFYLLVATLVSPLNAIMKIIVDRPRPSVNLVDVLTPEKGQSFPSGHVAYYTAFWGLLFIVLFFTPKLPLLLRRIVQFLALFLIAAISLSRIFLGAHWPSDTLGGYLLGLIVLVPVTYFYRQGLPATATSSATASAREPTSARTRRGRR